MSAPTLWEEGRWSGTRVTRFSIFASLLLVTVDLTLSAELGLVFDTGFVLLCVTIALAVRPADFFAVGVLPPMLLLGLFVLLGLVSRGSIAPADDNLVQAVISGLAHHSGPLMLGYSLTLAGLAIRSRIVRRRAAEATGPGPAVAAYSKRLGSPAPYRVTSGAPEVKSTTVVGNEPHSPESMTASST